ncbi:hypothetical protein RO3G_00188 [Rhizopus delemar RA 99-880]|uniref:Uncharacterized protein n=1 Tax=Rhizopus delemar (strain RA 99-880 / ATCC MYA-4621 / FGSC 9543 / NRRL 43880) TaxID=246409 RepID=I1BH04_RHIO9|nr:hypothetical protein RO3G_00188 [Rhizopus delemar RA 99-880]|eukprot:EIE75484.1 hypothetical protein RO3G_00188 [Rhizopus delemar RA 99-880]
MMKSTHQTCLTTLKNAWYVQYSLIIRVKSKKYPLESRGGSECVRKKEKRAMDTRMSSAANKSRFTGESGDI